MAGRTAEGILEDLEQELVVFATTQVAGGNTNRRGRLHSRPK
jgi:hypothetical protein